MSNQNLKYIVFQNELIKQNKQDAISKFIYIDFKKISLLINYQNKDLSKQYKI